MAKPKLKQPIHIFYIKTILWKQWKILLTTVIHTWNYYKDKLQKLSNNCSIQLKGDENFVPWRKSINVLFILQFLVFLLLLLWLVEDQFSNFSQWLVEESTKIQLIYVRYPEKKVKKIVWHSIIIQKVLYSILFNWSP
jgi:hypothetical protein